MSSDILDFCAIIDNKAEYEVRNNFENRLDFVIDKEILDKNPETIRIEVSLADGNKLINIDDPAERYLYEYWREVNVQWIYKVGETEASLGFRYWFIGYSLSDSPEFGYTWEVVDPIKFKLKELQDLKIKTRKAYGLIRMDDYKSEYFPSDIYNKFTMVCRSKNLEKPLDDYEFLDDLCFTAHNILYSISELLLYKPYVQDFLAHRQFVGGECHHMYTHSFYDEQYFYIASQIMQTIHTFWDKIANLLHHFFFIDVPLPGKNPKVYFTSVMKHFPEDHKNEHYQWLNSFRENLYRKNNKKRNGIVHTMSLSSESLKKYVYNVTNVAVLQELQDEKMELATDFINHYESMLLGFEKAAKLIDTLEPYELKLDSDSMVV